MLRAWGLIFKNTEKEKKNENEQKATPNFEVDSSRW